MERLSLAKKIVLAQKYAFREPLPVHPENRHLNALLFRATLSPY